MEKTLKGARMKKLSIVALSFLISTSVLAQGQTVRPDPQAGAAGAGSGVPGAGLGAIGGIATGTIVAGAIAAGVLAAVVSNNRSESPVDCPTGQTLVNGTCQANQTPKCQGSDQLVSGFCVGSRNEVVVTGTGTGTATTTISVPVTFTYAPTLG
jgi:hypothetical protein